MQKSRWPRIIFVGFFFASCRHEFPLPAAGAKEMEIEHKIQVEIPVMPAKANVAFNRDALQGMVPCSRPYPAVSTIFLLPFP